jgi:hypothetical protein
MSQLWSNVLLCNLIPPHQRHATYDAAWVLAETRILLHILEDGELGRGSAFSDKEPVSARFSSYRIAQY